MELWNYGTMELWNYGTIRFLWRVTRTTLNNVSRYKQITG